LSKVIKRVFFFFFFLFFVFCGDFPLPLSSLRMRPNLLGWVSLLSFMTRIWPFHGSSPGTDYFLFLPLSLSTLEFDSAQFTFLNRGLHEAVSHSSPVRFSLSSQSFFFSFFPPLQVVRHRTVAIKISLVFIFLVQP